VGLLGLEVVDVGAVLPADFERIAEPLGRDERGVAPRPLEHGVGGDGGAVTEELDRLGRVAACASLASRPSTTPCSGLSGVEESLVTEMRPSWTATTSVKVPPMSTPTRTSSLTAGLLRMAAGSSLCYAPPVTWVFLLGGFCVGGG